MMAGQECAEVVCLAIRLSFIQCSDRLAVQAPAGSGRQYQASEYQQATQQMEQAEVFPEENNRQYRGINRRKVHENGSPGRANAVYAMVPERIGQNARRSEERRVGKECRSRWSS